MRINTVVFMILFVLCSMPSRADVTDGLVGWWKLDETAGVSLADHGSGNNAGTASGTTITAGCKKDRCRSFNGAADYVSVGTSNRLTGDKTVSAWIKSSNCHSTDTHATIGVVAWNENGGYIFWIHNGDLKWGDGDSQELLWTGGESQACDGNWHNAVAIRSGAGGSIWLDGVQKASKGSGFTDSTSSGFTRIGDYYSLGAEQGHFSGLQDDVRIYNRALSDNEVMAIYQAGSPRLSVKGSARLSGLKIP